MGILKSKVCPSASLYDICDKNLSHIESAFLSIIYWDNSELCFVSRNLRSTSIKKAHHFGKGLENIYTKVFILNACNENSLAFRLTHSKV